MGCIVATVFGAKSRGKVGLVEGKRAPGVHATSDLWVFSSLLLFVHCRVQRWTRDLIAGFLLIAGFAVGCFSVH
jgi:hypothetical protein